MAKIQNGKKAILRVLLPCILGAVLLFALSACNKKSNAAGSGTLYDLDMTYDKESGTIDVAEEILYTFPADSEELVLHLYANAYNEQNDVIDILTVQFNRQSADYEIYGEDKTLMKIACSAKEGETSSVFIKYALKLPRADARLGITERGDVNLTCFYPVIARYENGWREDCCGGFGDPFYSDTATFFVSLNLDRSLTVASSGERLERTVNSNSATVEIEAENVRDFGMAIGNFECVSSEAKIGNKKVDVNYFYFDDELADDTLGRAVSSLTVFSETFGEYSHDSFSVVQSNINGAGGMEYGGFVLISPNAQREIYLDTVTHEAAHQWWYDAVGSDQLNSAWLDEGLAEFCTYYYDYLTGNRTAFAEAMRDLNFSYASFAGLKQTVGFDGRMNRHLSTYLTDGEYVAVTYVKGALLFDTLRKIAGDETFRQALSIYYKDNYRKIATQSSLTAAFDRCGINVAPIVSAFTEDKEITFG